MRIILIHGFGCTGGGWSAQLDHLARSAHVVAIDLADDGNNGHATGSLIGAMAVNDVRRSASPDRTVLVGHSMGCRVALEAALRMTEDLGGIVLIEGSLRAAGDPDEAVRRYRSRSEEENRTSLERDFLGMFTVATTEASRKLAMQRIETMDGECAERLMADMTWWDAADAAGALRGAQVALLVIQSTYKEPGGERRLIEQGEMSPWLRLISEQAPKRADIVRRRDVGHFAQIEAPEVVNRLIASFVQRLVS